MATAPTLSLGRIDHGSSLRDLVEQRVSAAIISGDMAAGEVFSAPMLATEFGVSVTPVREAMMNLEKRGFVTTLRNKGFRVTEVSQADLQQIVDVRRMLEPPAMQRLADAYPAARARHRQFRVIADRTVAAVRKGDLADYILADFDLHVGLVDMLGNPRLTALVSDLRQQTRLAGLPHLRASAELEQSTGEHDQLLDLLEAGRGADAKRLMLQHVGHILGQWSGNPEPPTGTEGDT